MLHFRLTPIAAALSVFGAIVASALAYSQTVPTTPPPSSDAANTAARKEPDAASVNRVDAIEVVGRRQGGGYEASDVSGTKSSLPLRELPQSVRVISRQAMDDLGATRLDEVLDYVGGVSRQNNFGGLWDNIAIRGLAGNENTGMATLLNGLAANRGFNAPRDLADVERIEFLKGPVAALYGASEPGGTINILAKKPQWRRATAVELYGGSWDSFRVAIDTTGPLSDRFAYRLNAAAEDRGSFRDFVKSKRQVFAPAFMWRVDEKTVLEFTGQVLRHETPLDRGVQAINGVLGQIPLTQFPGEANDGAVRVDNQSYQFVLNRELAADWSARAALSWKGGTLKGVSTEPSSVRPDGRTLWRQRRERDYSSDDLAGQIEVQGKLRAGGVTHEVLLGVDAYRYEIDTLMLRVNPSAAVPYALDLLAPVYGQAQPVPGPNTNTLENQRGYSLTAQNAMSIGNHWRFVAGVRAETVEQTLLNRRTSLTTEQSPTEVSPRAGVTWLPAAGWSVFANAGRSFRPNPGVDVNARAFEPEIGRALEAGVKWEAANGRLGATLAAFDIKKRNVVYNNGSGNNAISGQVGSRGIEFDLAGQITPHWRVTASAGIYDTTVKKDQTLQVGSRLLNVPRVNASVLAVYENAAPNGGRFGVGVGVTHMGERVGQAYTAAEAAAGTSAFNLPAYTTTKLVAYWRVSPLLRVSLDIDNVFDEALYTSSYSRVWVTPGAPRNATLGFQLKF